VDNLSEMKVVSSRLEGDARPAAGWAAHSKGDYGPEDVRDRRLMAHLGRYYDEVISAIQDATAILIFGPGEAY
jgi:hypothetical protein